MSDSTQYTVGWICALTLELTAARQFLDVEHQPTSHLAANDTNSYTLGEMAGHNIVIAVLPEIGTNAASSATANLLNSFPNIKFGLMVGIGGGVPSRKNDIRLGDVVVSKPTNGVGGVYQYDFGKTIQGREFQQTGHLNQPPPAVLAAIKNLESLYDSDGHKIKENIETILEKKPRLRKKYQQPSQLHDRLYKSNIPHPDEDDGSCEELCGTESTKFIERHQREDDEDDPAVHYGVIASANQVMKDACVRDDLARSKGILCFEMEAAGMMNQFPCLVVRGICDYSDSHKNNEWQGYAAMTAAAYTKDLLNNILPWLLEREERLRDIHNSLESVHDEVTHVRTIAEEISHGQQSSRQQQLMRDIQKWLSPSDSSISQNKAFKLRHQGTGQWLLNSTFYLSWEKRLDRFIWLHGLSGCGKTVLASSIIHRLNSASPSRALAFFYFDVNGGGQQTVVQMLRTLLFQLCSRSPIILDRLQTLYNTCGKGTSSPSIDQLSDTLKDIIGMSSQVTVVVDALDECDKPSEVISWLEDLLEANYSTLQLLVTSRSTGETGRAIDGWTRCHELHAIQVDGVNKDISDYLHTRLFVSDEFSRWSSHEGLQEMIKKEVSQQANGMFRLAACQLEDLKRCKNPERLSDALRTLPKTLQEIYARTLTSLKDSDYCTEALFMLQYLVWSEIPITLDEMLDATAVRLHETPAFKEVNRIFDIGDLITLCSSLVTIVEVSRFTPEEQRMREIHLAHSSVKEYLRSRHLARPFDQLSEEIHARGSIAQTCIGYLMSLPIDHFWHPSQNQFPFAAVASHWMEHAKVAEATDDTLVQLILKLYQMESARLGTAEGNDIMNNWATDSGKLPYIYWHDVMYDYEYLRFAEIFPYQKGLDVLYERPLMHASHWGLETVVHRLLRAGADVNADQCFDSPLHAAAFNGHDSVVRMLLERDANVNGANDGQSPIPLVATSFNGHVKTAQILLQHGASIYARPIGGHDAFEMAIRTYHSEFLRFLLRNRLLLEQPSGILTNAYEKLHLMNRRPGRCVHGAQDRRRRSAEMAAGLQDLDLAVDPSCTHFCLHEALIDALWLCDFACTEALIENGADPRGCRHNCGNEQPIRPWSCATGKTVGPDSRRILNLLREKGAELDGQAPRSDLLEGLYYRVRMGELSDVLLILELLGDMVPDVQELNQLRQCAVDRDNHVDLLEVLCGGLKGLLVCVNVTVVWT
ncbi:hypothetical protein D6D08_02641 [Aureobasidium pullulans]|nr:hypothetical protein D6D08_02641 [Aureobasidium pullulans]